MKERDLGVEWLKREVDQIEKKMEESLELISKGFLVGLASCGKRFFFIKLWKLGFIHYGNAIVKLCQLLVILG